MELEGRKELVDTGKSSRKWSVPIVPLRLAVLNVFQGRFGPKMAAFGPKLQLLKLRSATCESCSRPPPLSFLLKLCVIVLHTHRYHPPKFHLNLKHHDGVLISPISRVLLLAACLLLLNLVPWWAGGQQEIFQRPVEDSGGGTGGGGGMGATPWFRTPTTPPTNCWPEAPGGGGDGGDPLVPDADYPPN